MCEISASLVEAFLSYTCLSFTNSIHTYTRTNTYVTGHWMFQFFLILNALFIKIS